MKSRQLAVLVGTAALAVGLPAPAQATVQPQAWQVVGYYPGPEECKADGEKGLAEGKWRDYACFYWVGWMLSADVIEPGD